MLKYRHINTYIRKVHTHTMQTPIKHIHSPSRVKGRLQRRETSEIGNGQKQTFEVKIDSVSRFSSCLQITDRNHKGFSYNC